jgi:RND family efflux transporter MFP subunit
VRTAAVEAGAKPGRRIAATILARQRATLASRMSATVLELPFDEGESVRAGQLVARLADDALRSGLAAAEAGLVAARADRERMERLLERDAATPRETEAVRARAAAAEAEVEAARDALRYASLRAPFAGALARRLVREGDIVSPGQALVEIEGGSGFELRASIDARGAAALTPGTKLAVHVDGIGDPVNATVRAVTPAGDPGTHRFEVIADLAGVEGLRSGLYARLVLPAVVGGAAEASPELTIPADAAFARGGLIGVFVAQDGIARLRWIATGEREGEHLAVRAGLEPGERVVIDPAGLDDGDAITERR